MTIPARSATHRPDSPQPTAPRSSAGKAVARLNALPHGMGGLGDLLAPGESLAVVAQRAEAFGRELNAVGAMGQILAHRAAVLSVRMESLAFQNLVAGEVEVEMARDAFDADRAATLAGWVEALDGPDPTAALASLRESPDGIARLTTAWTALRAEIEGSATAAVIDRAARWFGRDGAEISLLGTADLVRRIDAEVDRLGGLAGTLGDVARAIDEARTGAGWLAQFEASPAAILARRYEAAAERGLYRAIRTIAELNRQAGRDAEATIAVPPPPGPRAGREVTSGLPRDLFDLLPPRLDAGGSAALASFRAGVSPRAAAPESTPTALDQPAGASRKRPDLRKLERKMAGSRR